MATSVRKCEEHFVGVMWTVVRSHLIPDEEKEKAKPFFSNVDAVASHSVFFALRDFVVDMNGLWHAVCTLIQIEHLYHP